MRCSGSQTICIAPSVRDVAAEFDAMLFAQAFAPLAKAMGFYGETVVAATARTLARTERGGLTDVLERTLESASQDLATRRAP